MSDTAASPVQKWKANIDILNAAIRQEAGKATCASNATPTNPGLTNYVTSVVPVNDTVGLMRDMYSLSSTGADFYAEVDAFLDPSGPLMELKPHRDSIEDIERSILETAQYVWSRCAQPIKMSTNVLEGKAGYNTKWRTLSEVLVAMTKQTKEVKRFFQILSQGIQTEEYIDEVPFLIATPGFSKDMYVYFSPKHIQECRDKDPRKWAFLDVLKGAFSQGWKYPQAIQVWKDAMALLLYRWWQITDTASYDAGKEAQINSLVQARKGGVGNSDIMIDSQFFKEFGYRPNSQSTDEKIDTQKRKTFYESMGYEFIRKVIPSIVAQWGTGGTGFVKSNQTQEEVDKIGRLQDIEESLYSQYGSRKEWVALSKEKDPQLSSDLAKTIQGSKERQKKAEEAYKNYCWILGKQATNVWGAWRCI